MTLAADGIQKLEARAALMVKTRLGLAALCVVVAFCVGWFGHRASAPSIPVAEQHTLDSLGFTAPIFRAHVDSTIHAETVYVTRATRAAHAGTSALTVARRDSALADSLEKAAFVAHDTAAVTWEGIAAARMVEAQHGMQAAESLRVALTLMTSARIAADERASLEAGRVVSLAAALRRTAADLAKADPPCRVLHFVHCPSRRASAVIGLGLGAAAVLLLPPALK